MRTLITLSEKELKLLKEICKRDKISRAEAIRRAVALYARPLLGSEARFTSDAFGIWKDKKETALEYEDKVRAEWERKSK